MDAPDGVDRVCHVPINRVGGEEKQEDDDEEDQQEKEEEHEDMDEDEDDGKEPRKIGQGEMVNTLPDHVDNMV